MAKRVGVDKWLFFTTLLLVVVGLVMVFSASAVVAKERYNSEFADVGRQAAWALAGVLAMLILMHVDYNVYKSPKFIYPALCVTTLLLVSVFLMPGSHNTHRWIRFGGHFTFQPSEIAKLVLILFLAWFLHTRLDEMRDWKNTLLRAAIMPLLCVAVPPLVLLLFMVPWRRQRMLVFLHPDSDRMGAGFHINQSLIAVGTGGLTGRGYMEGMQKLFYLPEAPTDFIFANIAEELGFIGAITILALFIVFGVRGLRAAFRSRDPFARLAAFGISTAILLQAFFNISVVLSLVPTKGIPLPLISSGGTSLFCTLASIGVLLNITGKVD
jgi:cell division protein FtsW